MTPQASGQTRSGATPTLRSTYYHLVGGRAHPAPPPRAVKTDLARDFRVEVVYAGSGRESINYQQRYDSVCAGYGGFIDTETDTVSPMTLDRALRGGSRRSALGGARPEGHDARARGQLRRRRLACDRHRGRQPLGPGLRVQRHATTFTCTTTFVAGGPDPGGQLSFPAGSGVEAGVPMAARQRGACNPDDFTLGPSLWDSGGATAIAGPLALLGGTLPARPYAPVKVSWPASSAQQAQGFAASPCQGDAAVCTDAFQWQGTVSLQPVPGR